MNNEEIKEILDYYRKKVNDKKETYTIVGKDTIYLGQLLDYITNLQEENKHNEKMLKTYKRVADLFKKDLITMSNLYTEEKSRNEKAIEYIKPKFISQGGLTSYEINDLLNDLLNILQGENNATDKNL